MKKLIASTLTLSLTALAGYAGTAVADPYGTNITIYDGSGYSNLGQGGEDGETEPGMVNSQAWDLEGFFLKNSTLNMVGGFDFKNGVPNYTQFSSGDVFIDIDGNYGSSQEVPGYIPVVGNTPVQSNFGYEYVLDLNFDDLTYDILALASDASTITAYYPDNEISNPGSNPWKYADGGNSIGSGQFSFLSGLTDTGFDGTEHYALTGFDLSFLGIGQDFTSHFTMGCGNDNLMGQGSTAPVPEPATMLLFGTGLAGLAMVRRSKKMHNK